MRKLIRFNAFQMNTVSHQSPGLWTHPRAEAHRYTDPDHWTELAQLLERGRFDAIFLADVLGATTSTRAAPTPPCATRCKRR
jgi:alkanesulfonate monooxygenase SsuD/methylene tetrahydromethanopterin reductase-like flavin-dependent oxidoreductase (luciferase family)